MDGHHTETKRDNIYGKTLHGHKYLYIDYVYVLCSTELEYIERDYYLKKGHHSSRYLFTLFSIKERARNLDKTDFTFPGILKGRHDMANVRFIVCIGKSQHKFDKAK